MVFNPGAAGDVVVDLSMLPQDLWGTVPVDLLALNQTKDSALTKSWTVRMLAGEVRAYGGFALGVFAPRQGKKDVCKPDDGYSKPAAGSTLQSCFLECQQDVQCEHVMIEYESWLVNRLVRLVSSLGLLFWCV